MSAWWDDDHALCLLTPAEYRALEKGTALTAIDGDTMVKGDEDQPEDDDLRGGYLAWGVTGDHPLRLSLLARTKIASADCDTGPTDV